MFTPEVPGKYTITAKFEGSESYYRSYAETAIGIDEAPAATPAPTQPSTVMSDPNLLPGIAAIIIAIAVVGVVLALLVTKKRP